jgi:hypothetical protein
MAKVSPSTVNPVITNNYMAFPSPAPVQKLAPFTPPKLDFSLNIRLPKKVD